ncbi:MAG: ATP-binding protein [Nitrososphaera sp.]
MEIRTKLFLSIIATGALLAISGYILFGQLSKVGKSFDEVQNQATPSIIALGNVKSDFNQLVAAILAYTLHNSDEHQEEVDSAKEQLLQSYDRYAELEKDTDAAGKLGDDIFTLTLLGDTMIEVAQGGAVPQHVHNADGSVTILQDAQPEGSAAAAGAAGGPDITRLHSALEEFDQQAMIVKDEIDSKIDANVADMQAKQGAVLADIEGGTSLTVLLTVSAMVVVGVIGGLVAYSISKRVNQLRKTADVIAQGNLQEHITTGGSDEIAALAANFEKMRESLVQTQEELKGSNLRLQDLNAVLEKANIELKKLDKLKDEFIGIAAHELRTPIHPILGYASMAKDGMVPKEQALDMIYKQALRLKQLANDILDVSRIESGTLPYSMRSVKIHELLRHCADAARPNVDPGVSLVTNFGADSDIEVKGDAERLMQVFMNIIGNAIKFTKKGRIVIETRLDPARNFIVTISDTAGGIPEEILPTLFGKFVTKKVGENVSHGTGLGLFISKAIVAAHNGRISAYNNDIGGATFQIELPAQGEKLPAVVEREKKTRA